MSFKFRDYDYEGGRGVWREYFLGRFLCRKYAEFLVSVLVDLGKKVWFLVFIFESFVNVDIWY